MGRNPNFNVVVDAAGGSRWWSWWLLLRLVLLGQRLDSDDGRSIRILHPFQGAQIHYPSLYCLRLVSHMSVFPHHITFSSVHGWDGRYWKMQIYEVYKDAGYVRATSHDGNE